MSVKLVLLKSNEEVIADVQELVDENDKVMFLVLTNPFTCKIVEAPEMLVEGVEETEDRYSVQFFPWMPLSKEKRISIDPTWVCLLYTSPSPRDQRGSRMPSSA